MRLFDTHSHYTDEAFDNDRDEVISSLPFKGVEKVCAVGSSLETSKKSVALAEKYPFVIAAAGIHPEDASSLPCGWENELISLLKHEKVKALGEIGLDYYYDEVPHEVQKQVFESQLRIARELDLPVILHTREATLDTLEILKRYPGVTGVCHCFSGSAETAGIFLKMGWMISFTGVLTFKNARKAAEACACIPPERLMTETDCPYMAPVPYRGRRCDSGMMEMTLLKMAEIKGMDPEKLAEILFSNAERFFRL